jgi:hypothetical protein
MNLQLINQILYPIFCLVILTSILGYGQIIRKYNPLNQLYNFKNLVFIQGLMFVSFFTIPFNYLSAITNFFSILILLLGSIIYIFYFLQLSNKKKELKFLLVIIFISFIISFFSGVSDDFNYHYETIKNFKNYNLFEISHHRRISYNSHWLFLNSVFSIDYLTSTIFILTALFYAILVYDLYKYYQKNLKNNNYFSGIISFFILIFCLGVLNKYKDFGTDIPGTIISFYILIIIISFTFDKKNIRINNLIFFIIPLISFAFIIKITNTLLIIFLLLLIIKLNFKQINYKYFFVSCLISLSLPLLWFFQNYIISGCLIWPIEITCFANNDLALNEYYLIESFAKGDIETSMNVNGYIWIFTWLDSHLKKLLETYLVFTLVILFPLYYFLTSNNKIRKDTFNFYIKSLKNSYYVILISIIVFSNILWFLLAPAYRFGIFYNLSLIIFLILPLWLRLILNNYTLTLKISRIIFLIIVVYFLAVNINKFNWYVERYDIWPPIKENKLISRIKY